MTADSQSFLTALYRQQAELYARTLTLTQQETPAAVWLPEVLAGLREVKSLEAGAAETRAAWQRAGRPTGPELRAALDAVAGLLQQLEAAVDSATRAVEVRRAQLLPEVENFLRFQQMQHAYRKTARFAGS